MKKIFTLICGLGLSICISAQPVLLKNINTTTVDVFSGSFPKKGIELNGAYYFPATDYNGNELWKTNGTGAGTSLIRDVAGIFERQDANPGLFNIFGNDLYFFTSPGLKLYRYNSITTSMNITNFGRDAGYTPTEAVVIGNYIYFASDAYFDEGVELLRYDVTNAVLDIFNINTTGQNSSYPHNLTVKGDSLFFAADNGINGIELWLFDTNTDSYDMVKDINVSASSNPSDLIIYNDKLFFTAADGINGNELWSSDGSELQTTMFGDINTENAGADSSNPAHKIVFNNKLYFSATNGFDGIEIWEADDNTNSFSLFADINPFGDAYPGKYGFKQVGAYLYFAADNGNDGVELWRTDGTPLNAEQVLDINASGNAEPMDMYEMNGELIFVANDGNGFELWKTDGTLTSMIYDAQVPWADTLRISGIYNNNIYFSADNGTIGQELWKSDGTGANTSLLKDINHGAGISSDPQWFEPFSSSMYFGARTSPPYYFSLYKTDGTTGNATEIKAGGGVTDFSVSYEHAKKAGSYLYFAGYTSAEGNELWRSDGTSGGTVMVKDIYAGFGHSSPGNMIEMGSTLIFTSEDGINGRELWKSDGTLAGTILVKDINPGITDSDIREMRLLNGKVCFVANDGTNGEELWITDGTTGGTFLLKDINGIAAGSNISDLYVAGTKLYFSADDGVNGKEMWVTDGTPVGTVLFKNINPGSNSSNASFFVQLGSYIYFSASDVSNGYSKLWRTDGTAANTSQFFDINFPFLLTKVNNNIVFIALPASSTNGFHIWSTDGTVTQEVEDFLPGEVGVFLLDEFPVYNNKWFLWIDDFINGQELWQTDGSSAGTIMYDIAPGPHSSYPRSARGLNPLIFSADDGTITGRELWKLDVSGPVPITGLQFNVSKKNDQSLLDWKTYSEINNKGFEVQRSRNAVQFDSIGYVAASGLIVNGGKYNFTDMNPFTGKNYYRLKQIDFDGKITYSPTRWVDFSKESYVKLYPNPTQDILYINTGYSFRDATLSIRNMGGQLVKQIKVNGAGTITIPVKDLSAGVYNVEILQPGQTVRLVFIKQ